MQLILNRTYNMTQKEEIKEQGYDEIPYASYPFEFNRPENLKSLAKMFGLEAAHLSKARVLELGGSDGVNLLRFAVDYPESYCLGIDLSKVEIEHGQKRIEELGLKNYELKHLSITDLDESYGKFDYIICHGVYSWVPKFVRDKIFEVSKKLLNKNGLVFISYNTLPGWNMVGTVRELMQYHASIFANNYDKITQARLALKFITDSLEGSSSAYSKFLSLMTEQITSKEDHYLRHEYLADENKAFYFHEFMTDARSHGLDYLGDTDIQRMFLGNLPAKAAEMLSSINDIVRTEQYVDFIKNTQFRCTVLCHNDATLTRNITNETLSQFYYSSYILPKLPATREEINKDSSLEFYFNNNKDNYIVASSKEMKAFLAVFSENAANPLKIDEIVKLATKKLDQPNKDKMLAEIYSVLGRLVFGSYFKFYADKPKYVYEASNKPKVNDVNLHRFNGLKPGEKVWVTNQINQMILLEDHFRFIIPLFNGKMTIAEIIDKVVEFIKAGALVAQLDGQTITDEALLKEAAATFVDRALLQLKLNFCLVA